MRHFQRMFLVSVVREYSCLYIMQQQLIVTLYAPQTVEIKGQHNVIVMMYHNARINPGVIK